MDKALVMLLSKLSAVNGLPDDADTPLVRTSNSEDSPIARLALVAKDGFDVNLEALGQYLDKNIVEPLNRTKWHFRKMNIAVAVSTKCGSLSTQINCAIPIDSIRSNGRVTHLIINDECWHGPEGKRSYAVRTEAVNYTPEKAGRIVLRTDISPTGTITFRCC